MMHHFDGWEWHSDGQQIFTHGFAIDVKRDQARLMDMLVAAHPQPVTVDQIRAAIKPASKSGGIYNLVGALRRKIEATGNATIIHLTGYGYRFRVSSNA